MSPVHRGFAVAFCLGLGACGTGGAAPPPGADRDASPPAVADTGATGDDVAPPVDRLPTSAVDATVAATPEAGPLPVDALPACGVCREYAPAERLGRVADDDLGALSGMAASWRNPGVLYVHNDREATEFFALTEAGVLLARFSLIGASVSDLEEMTVAACPAGSCVYIADIGNNYNPRSEFAIYRAPEPAINPTQSGPDRALTAERLAFRYPDGDHNAESLLIDPATGDLFIVTKVEAGRASAVYHLPTLATDRIDMAVKVADLPVPLAGDQPATAASAHPCGGGFLLRTGNALYEFRIPPGAPFSDAFRVTPVPVPVGEEIQGEAVSYRADGRGYYTTSEGDLPPIHRVTCRPE